MLAGLTVLRKQESRKNNRNLPSWMKMIPLNVYKIGKLGDFYHAGTTTEVVISTDKNEVMNGSSGNDEMMGMLCWAQFVLKLVRDALPVLRD